MPPAAADDDATATDGVPPLSLTANVILPTMLGTVCSIGIEACLFAVETLTPTRLLAAAAARALGWGVYVAMCAAAAADGYASTLDTAASLALFGAALGNIGLALCHLYSGMRGQRKDGHGGAEDGTALSNLGAYAPVGTADNTS